MPAVPPRARNGSSSDAWRAGTLSVPYTMFTLPNGLTVILHEDHSVPQVPSTSGITSARRARSRDARGSRTSSST